MVKLLKTLDTQRIEEAIRSVESDSQVEIVPVVAQTSSNYGSGNSLFAFTFALLALSLIWISFQALVPGANWGGFLVPKLGLISILSILILGYLLALLLARFVPALGLLFTTQNQRKNIVATKAQAEFQKLRVRNTNDNVGVLIYISMLERMVHIVGDDNVNKYVAGDEWQTLVDSLTADLKSKNITEALESAVLATGKILTPHLPITPGDTDELPNRVHFV